MKIMAFKFFFLNLKIINNLNWKMEQKRDTRLLMEVEEGNIIDELSRGLKYGLYSQLKINFHHQNHHYIKKIKKKK